MINWKLLCSLIDDTYILLYRVDDMIKTYPKTYGMYPSLVYTCIYKVGCLVICIYVCSYLHGYIYACTYMHIFNGDGFYEHFMILFTIYHLHNITSECPYNIMRCYFVMLKFKCTVSYFTVWPRCCFNLKCVLCITIIMCFVSNDEIKMFNHLINYPSMP